MLIQVTKTEMQELTLPAYFKDGPTHYCIAEDETIVGCSYYKAEGAAVSTNPKGSCVYDAVLAQALRSEPITATSFWYAFEKTIQIIQESLKIQSV